MALNASLQKNKEHGNLRPYGQAMLANILEQRGFLGSLNYNKLIEDKKYVFSKSTSGAQSRMIVNVLNLMHCADFVGAAQD